jgi:hypothetical protein
MSISDVKEQHDDFFGGPFEKYTAAKRSLAGEVEHGELPFTLRSSRDTGSWSPQARPDEVILKTYPPNDWVTDLLKEAGVEDESSNAEEQLDGARTVWPNLSAYALYDLVELRAWGVPSTKVRVKRKSM